MVRYGDGCSTMDGCGKELRPSLYVEFNSDEFNSN